MFLIQKYFTEHFLINVDLFTSHLQTFCNIYEFW